MTKASLDDVDLVIKTMANTIVVMSCYLAVAALVWGFADAERTRLLMALPGEVAALSRRVLEAPAERGSEAVAERARELERLRGMGIAAGHPLSETLAAACQEAGLNARLYPSAAEMKWSKMLTNLPANATAAILNMTAAEVFSHPGLFDLEMRMLRETLSLTGTKNGCSAGECGACTVLLNGEPVNSCMVLAVECDGTEIVTVEGTLADKSGRERVLDFYTHQRRVDQLRSLARRGRIIMAGRDIGTVVLPNADLRIYIDASLERRAERRYRQRREAGEPAEVIAAVAAQLPQPLIMMTFSSSIRL